MAEVALYESVLGSGAGGPLTAPTPWTQFPGYLTWAGALVIGGASGGNMGAGTINCKAVYDDGVLINLANMLPLNGGTMTGLLILSGDPTNTLGAAPKRYVDTAITNLTNTVSATYLAKAGGTLTGALILAADPTVALGAATKQYVDNRTGSVISIADAPSDGSTYGRNNATWTNIIDAGTY